MADTASRSGLDLQAKRLHRVVTELVNKYEFRDRNEICCHGISVSQCHALEVLQESDGIAMGALASRLHLTVSTVTRIVDQLVSRGLAQRFSDPRDRRVWRISLTQPGRDLLARIEGELLEAEKGILRGIPAAHRESVILALAALSRAVDGWQASCRAVVKGAVCDGT